MNIENVTPFQNEEELEVSAISNEAQTQGGDADEMEETEEDNDEEEETELDEETNDEETE